jgi:hypothetical protein
MKKAGFDTSKAFPSRTEGSVKKHWYKVRKPLLNLCHKAQFGKDMHYAEFAEDEVSEPPLSRAFGL